MSVAADIQTMNRPLLRRLQEHKAVAAVALTIASCLGIYAVVKLLGPALFLDNGWAVNWPVNAITVAVMLMVPRWCWPWIQLGSVIEQVHSSAGKPAAEILIDAISNTVEVAIVAWALPPFRTLAEWMQQPRLYSRFIGFALLLAPALTSIPMGLYYYYAHHQSLLTYAARWTLADMLGMSMWLPLALALGSREIYDLFRRHSIARTTLLLLLVCAVSWAVFHQEVYPLAFVIMPVVLLTVLVLGFSGSTLATVLVTIIVSHATLHGHGPFQLIPGSEIESRIVILQLFLTLCMLFSLPISILQLQRTQFELQLKDAYLRMEAAATRDGLTGVANRRSFDLTFEKEWRRAIRDSRSLALLMVDVDHFKLYNDTYGHVAGDDCLRRIAGAIAKSVQRSGDMVSRYGGEEFAVLLPGADERAARLVGALILSDIAALQIEHRRSEFALVSVSIGCRVLYPKLNASPASLVTAADQALYKAKLNGRNRMECVGPTLYNQPHSEMIASR